LGANANFVEVREDGDEKYLRIRTYERGVEGETLACGTGCMSAAIDCGLRGLVKTPVRLLTQSGEFVCVDFEIDGKHITNLSLEGPVVKGEEGILKFDENTGSIEVQYV
jgi:diaminopimelate epimerase